MAKAEDVIRIAIDEIGYREKASNKDLDDKTANSAKANNFTKYARDLDALGDFYNYKKQGLPSCDIFVDWTHWMANNKNVEKTLNELCQPRKSLGAGCMYSYRYYKNAGRVGKDPKIGAQIFYSSTGKEAGISHTGIVEKFDANYVYTVENNVSNACRRVKTARSSSKIYGYGYPRYDVEPTGNGFESNPANIDIPIHTMGELSRIVLATGKVTADTLNVRTGPGTKHAQLKSVPSVKKGKVVNICDAVKADDGAKWYFIQVDGKYGFVSAKYIEIVGNGSSSSASTDQGYVDGSQNYNTR